MFTLGKALSGGFYPVSAVLGNWEIFDLVTPNTHGSTFGGNPLACAIMKESLDVLIEDKLIENSEKMGLYLLSKLKEKIGNHWIVKEIWGMGLFIGLELKDDQEIDSKMISTKMMEKGVLVKNTREYILWVAPPLTI